LFSFSWDVAAIKMRHYSPRSFHSRAILTYDDSILNFLVQVGIFSGDIQLLEVKPFSEMLSRYIGRLHLLKTDIVKCGAHKCSSILDTTSKEAIGKPAKVQVRRALLRDFFIFTRNTKTLQGTSERCLESSRFVPYGVPVVPFTCLRYFE